MGEPIQSVFTYTRDEYTRAMKRHYRCTLRLGRGIVAGCIVVTISIYFLATYDDKWLGWFMLVPGVALLGMMGFALYALPSITYNAQPKLKQQYHLTFSEDGIVFVTDRINASLDWSFYHSWRRDNEFYFLYHGKRDVSVIPRRALSCSTVDERLAETLNRKIGARLP